MKAKSPKAIIPSNSESMRLILPDKSVVRLDKKTLRFHSIEPVAPPPTLAKQPAIARLPSTATINWEMLAGFLEKPQRRFSDCFRRISDHPRYSPKLSVHDFSVESITAIYGFCKEYQGGTFCSSNTSWKFLDGGIESHNGYGWGDRGWTVVQGYEALRALCMFYGIQQPRLIKGEPPRRALSLLLEDMTYIPD